MTYLTVGAGVLIIFLAVLAGIQYQTAKKERGLRIAAEQREEVIRGELTAANNAIKKLIKDIEDQIEEIAELQQHNNDIITERDQANARYDSLRKDIRERVLANPADLSRRATRATNRVMLDVRRVTDTTNSSTRNNNNSDITSSSTGTSGTSGNRDNNVNSGGDGTAE